MLKDAILRAVKWLRENPDKHITGNLAKNEAGRNVDPTDPDATCFCAAGRVLKELGLNMSNELPSELLYSEIWLRNDGFGQDVGDTCPVDEARREDDLGQPCALDYLEKVANEIA